VTHEGKGWLAGAAVRLLRLFFRLVNRSRRRRLAKFRLVSKSYARLAASLMPPISDEDLVEVSQNGLRMLADGRDGSGPVAAFYWGEYEPITTRVWQQLIGGGDVVVDVGANWGYFTLLAARQCGPRGSVFAFEPHPRNFAILTRNIAANGLGNVIATQKAVSDSEGRLALNVCPFSAGHSIRPLPAVGAMPGNNDVRLVVEATTLDSFFRDLPVQPKIVKIDVEGAEALVIAGMHKLMQRCPDLTIIAELNPDYLGGDSADRLLGSLFGMGFQFAVIDDDHRFLHPAAKEEVVVRITQNQGCNLLCARDPKILKFAGL